MTKIENAAGKVASNSLLTAGARITWATMSVAGRNHPLIGALIAAELATAAEVDALFVAGAATL